MGSIMIQNIPKVYFLLCKTVFLEVKIFIFLSTFFQNKDFISQESPILADVENIFYWIRIIDLL